jgi:hypothetical protein
VAALPVWAAAAMAGFHPLSDVCGGDTLRRGPAEIPWKPRMEVIGVEVGTPAGTPALAQPTSSRREFRQQGS